MADLVWSDPDPDKEEFAISPRLVNSGCFAGILDFEIDITHHTEEQDTPSELK